MFLCVFMFLYFCSQNNFSTEFFSPLETSVDKGASHQFWLGCGPAAGFHGIKETTTVQ